MALLLLAVLSVFKVSSASLFFKDEIVWNSSLAFKGATLTRGDFSWVVDWDAHLNVLRILSNKYKDRKCVSAKTVWSSNPGLPFAGCAYSCESGNKPLAEQYGGNFKMVRKVDIKSHKQTIESFTVDKDSVSFKGKFYQLYGKSVAVHE